MKILNIYKNFFLIVILLSIFVYFYVDTTIEKRIHDLFIRYKDSFQSYLILNELYSGEKLKVGNINFRFDLFETEMIALLIFLKFIC